MLRLLKAHNIDITVVTSTGSDRSFVSDIDALGIQQFRVPHELTNGYPDMKVEGLSELVRQSDVIWISDIEYLAAARLKRIRRDIPIIAQLHSPALICSLWTKLFGMREQCTTRCSPSRITRCKQLTNDCLRSRWGRVDRRKAMIYALLDYAKGAVDFARWPMRTMPLTNIDGFVTVSRFAKSAFLTDLPQLLQIPFEVVRNPVIVPEHIVHKDFDNTARILYAGGPGMIKGPHLVLNSVKRLRQRGIRSPIVTMLGVQGDRWIEGIARQLGVESHVELLPRLTRAEMYALMAESQVVLAPSIWPEVFGRVPVEANKLGTPAIVSNRGGLPETIIDGVTGLVTEPSVEALAKSIDDALRADWNRELIAHTAKERFDPESIVDDFIHFLETFI